MPISKEKLKALEEKSKLQNREIHFGEWYHEKREDGTLAEDEADNFNHIHGKAVAFNDKYIRYDDEDIHIEEEIDPHAFDESDMSDVVLNANHGEGNYAVARTRNKTLRLIPKEDGIYIEADFDKKNERTTQFYRDVKEGLLDRMSFAFTIKDYKRTEEEEPSGKINIRYLITKVDKVYDVSAVEFPAYQNTAISATRAKDLVKSLETLVKDEQRRSKAEKLIARIEAIQKQKI